VGRYQWSTGDLFYGEFLNGKILEGKLLKDDGNAVIIEN